MCILVRLKQYRLFRIQIAYWSFVATISRYSRQHILLDKTKTTINEEIVSIPVGFFYTSVYFFEKKTWFIWIGTTLKSPNENFATNFKLIANSHVFARIPRWPRLKLILLTHISVYLAFVKTVEKPAGKRIWRQRPNSMVLSSCQNVWNYFSFFNFKSLLWWHVVQDFSRLADTWPLIPQESRGLPRRVGRP